MPSTITEKGANWLRNRSYQETDDHISQIAVGTGFSEPSKDDITLVNEIYRASVEDGNVEFRAGHDPNTLSCGITIDGGDHVDAGTALSEFGIFSESGVLLYREVREDVLVTSQDQTKFEIELQFEVV